MLFKSPRPQGYQEQLCPLKQLPEAEESRVKGCCEDKEAIISKHHRREEMDFAIAHKDWTLEDWKHVVCQMRPKLIVLGQMRGDGSGETWGEPNDRLVEGTLKFGGGSVMLWAA